MIGNFRTPPEAAKLLGISERTIRRWLKKKHVPANKRPSGHYLIPMRWIEEQMKETEHGSDTGNAD
jgi:excisionase family DNA binding protein